MLERKRKNKHYDIVPGDEPGDDGEVDLELGEGVGGSVRDQETGVVSADANGQAEAGAAQSKATNVTEELDNWDENEEDWEADGGDAKVDGEDTKKRTD
jgi:hypothetical protein